MNKSVYSTVVPRRCVIIGLGRIAWRLEGGQHRSTPCTHAGAFHFAEETELIGGFDINPEQCADFKSRYSSALTAHDSLGNFLQITAPEIISVCTSSSEHLSVLKEIRQYAISKPGQLKGLLLEKPLGISAEEGREIRNLVQEMRAAAVVCHDRRFYPWFQMLKKELTEEITGPLRHIRGAVYASSVVKGRNDDKGRFFFGGPLLHDGTHLIDLMCYFAGKPQYVTGVCLREEKDSLSEETCCGNIFFDSGVSASFFTGGRRRYFHFEIALEWERALLTDANGHSSFYVKEEGDFLLKKAELPIVNQENPYMRRLKHLLNIIDGKEECYSSIDDGLMVLETIDGIYKSARNKSVIVPVGENFITSADACGIVYSDREVE